MAAEALEWTELLKTGGGYALAVIMGIVLYFVVKHHVKRQEAFDAERKALAKANEDKLTKLQAAYEQKFDGVRDQVIELLKKQTELTVVTNNAMVENTSELGKVRADLRPTQESLDKLILLLTTKVHAGKGGV